MPEQSNTTEQNDPTNPHIDLKSKINELKTFFQENLTSVDPQKMMSSSLASFDEIQNLNELQNYINKQMERKDKHFDYYYILDALKELIKKNNDLAMKNKLVALYEAAEILKNFELYLEQVEKAAKTYSEYAQEESPEQSMVRQLTSEKEFLDKATPTISSFITSYIEHKKNPGDNEKKQALTEQGIKVAELSSEADRELPGRLNNNIKNALKLVAAVAIAIVATICLPTGYAGFLYAPALMLFFSAIKGLYKVNFDGDAHVLRADKVKNSLKHVTNELLHTKKEGPHETKVKIGTKETVNNPPPKKLSPSS